MSFYYAITFILIFANIQEILIKIFKFLNLLDYLYDSWFYKLILKIFNSSA